MTFPIIQICVSLTKNRNLFKICLLLIVVILASFSVFILNYKFEFKIKNQSLNYDQIHNRIVSNKSSKIRVVFYSDPKNGGYGNKLYSLITAFLIALVTESALLIDWPEIGNYIKEPFTMSFHRFNDSTYLDFNQKHPSIYTINTKSVNSWNFNKRVISEPIENLENVSRYFVSDIIPYFFDLCQNRQYADKLVRYGYVRNSAIYRAFGLLNDQDLLESQKTDLMLLIGFEFAGNFLNKHWVPKKDLEIKINRIIKTDFKNSFVIGIQLRFEFLDVQDIDSFIECAKTIEIQEADKIGTKIKWFVSSDQLWVIEKFKNITNGQLLREVITGKGKLDHVLNDPNAYERAVLDVELLSRCDRLVLTGGSTYGFVAALKTRRRPFYVNGRRNVKKCELFDFSAPSRRPTGEAVF